MDSLNIAGRSGGGLNIACREPRDLGRTKSDQGLAAIRRIALKIAPQTSSPESRVQRVAWAGEVIDANCGHASIGQRCRCETRQRIARHVIGGVPPRR
jgi:hypothetical protein